MTVNEQGLKRNIPESVKTAVRKACSFGCVICGSVPYDYDHLEVEYHAAEQHNPDDIVLLCQNHHRMKGNVLSVEAIKKARALRVAQDSQFRFKLPATNSDFVVNWAGTKISATDNSVIVDDERILTFTRTENEMEPVQLSGTFRDIQGNIICQIDRNEFVSRAANLGDFSVVSNRFRYKLQGGGLGLSFDLTGAGLNIDYIFHVKNDAHVYAPGEFLQVGNVHQAVRLTDSKFSDSGTAIIVNSTADKFSYENVDLDRFPTIFMSDQTYVGTRVGIHLKGLARQNLTATMRFDW